MKVQRESFIVKNSGALDGNEVECGPVQSFSFKTDSGILTRLKLRKILEFPSGVVVDDDQQTDCDGLWVLDSNLERIDQDEKEVSVTPVFIKTTEIRIPDYVISLLEYNDRLQLSIQKHKILPASFSTENEVIFSGYIRKVFYGSLLLKLQEISKKEDIEKFISEVKELD